MHRSNSVLFDCLVCGQEECLRHAQAERLCRADPRTLQSDVAQQRVERGARLTLVDGIDPDQDAVHREQLVADRVSKAFVIDRWAGLDAGTGQCLEDADEAAVLRPAAASPRQRIATE